MHHDFGFMNKWIFDVINLSNVRIWKSGDRLFSRASWEKTKGNGLLLKEGRFRLDIRKKYLEIRVVKLWDRLPREVVDASIPGNIQGRVGQGSEQPDLVDVPAHFRGWTTWPLNVPYNPNYSIMESHHGPLDQVAQILWIYDSSKKKLQF